jgi:hypothetical protein
VTGRRKMVTLALALFTVFSVACTSGTDAEKDAAFPQPTASRIGEGGVKPLSPQYQYIGDLMYELDRTGSLPVDPAGDPRIATNGHKKESQVMLVVNWLAGAPDDALPWPVDIEWSITPTGPSYGPETHHGNSYRVQTSAITGEYVELIGRWNIKPKKMYMMQCLILFADSNGNFRLVTARAGQNEDPYMLRIDEGTCVVSATAP